MLNLSSVGFGYCANCGLLTGVGQMLLTGFRHQFFICAACLRKTADKIERDAEAIAQRNKRRTGGE